MQNKFQQLIVDLQHIGIPTNNIQQTILFYQKLGFEAAYQTINQKTGEKVAFLKYKDIVIETYENQSAALKSGAIDHIALNVLDIEAAFSEAKKNDFTLLDNEVNELPFWDNGVRFFTILGPNNEKVEFSQYL